VVADDQQHRDRSQPIDIGAVFGLAAKIRALRRDGFCAVSDRGPYPVQDCAKRHAVSG
jgi:hypothetical protein